MVHDTIKGLNFVMGYFNVKTKEQLVDILTSNLVTHSNESTRRKVEILSWTLSYLITQWQKNEKKKAVWWFKHW